MGTPFTIAAINAGSSSVRLALIELAAGAEPRVVEAQHLDSDAHASERVLREFFTHIGSRELGGTVHRIVHGGHDLVAPVLYDEDIDRALAELVPLAPLHLPAELAWLRGARRMRPELPHACVFDTAFFVDLPEVAASYALPRALARRHGIRRFGFHGLAHAALWRGFCALRSDLPYGGRLLTLQLGSGCSISALDRGRPMDTSMGFTPLEGLIMATRTGDIDAGAVLHLQRRERLDADALSRVLDKESGLLGLSELSGDVRRLQESAAGERALAVYAYRIKKYVGAYAFALGGLDAIVFGGGVGEHSARVRADCLAGLERFGIVIDAERNRDAQPGARISPDSASVDVRVVATDEARELARQALTVLSSRQRRAGGET